MAGGIVSNCFFCGASGPAGSSCPSCLVLIPRLSPEVATSFACPRCAGGAPARGGGSPMLAIGIAPQATIHACPGCQGVFLGARAWCTLVARPELAPAIASRLPARASDRPSTSADLLRMLQCPACAREMERGRFGASSNIVIDVCTSQGHGIWLDAGELVAIAEHGALRARVGVDAARRATDAAESHRYDPTRAAADAEAAMHRASIAARTKTVKRTGFFVLLALLALRIAYFLRAGGSAAPPEVTGAGESAATASTVLQNR